MARLLCFLLVSWTPLFGQEIFNLGDDLEPRIDHAEPLLRFDFPEVLVGSASYPQGPTGVTAIIFPKGAVAAVDVRGGSVCSLNTDPLDIRHGSGSIEAIAIAGGSCYGLEAATAIASGMLKKGTTNTRWDGDVALVSGAILFDFAARYNSIYPDARLGRAALDHAKSGVFPLGSQGAGIGVWQGDFFEEFMPGGQGAAFRQIGETKIAVFTVVNANGAIVNREGNLAACRHSPEYRSIHAHFQNVDAFAFKGNSGGTVREPASDSTQNTTHTVVVTNRILDRRALNRIAVQVHASMSRAIQPFNTSEDGDVLWAVSTGTLEDGLGDGEIAAYASELAWDAVLASVPAGLPSYRDHPRIKVDLTENDLSELAGDYAFLPDQVVTLRVQDGLLLGKMKVGADLFELFPNKGWLELYPESDRLFFLGNFWDDVIEFYEQDGKITGFILNPGPRGVPARRLPN